jgi:hypothetical protein
MAGSLVKPAGIAKYFVLLNNIQYCYGACGTARWVTPERLGRRKAAISRPNQTKGTRWFFEGSNGDELSHAKNREGLVHELLGTECKEEAALDRFSTCLRGGWGTHWCRSNFAMIAVQTSTNAVARRVRLAFAIEANTTGSPRDVCAIGRQTTGLPS